MKVSYSYLCYFFVKVIVGTKTDLREDKRTIQNVAKQRKRIITPSQVKTKKSTSEIDLLCL